jgi:hypothetical protein
MPSNGQTPTQRGLSLDKLPMGIPRQLRLPEVQIRRSQRLLLGASLKAGGRNQTLVYPDGNSFGMYRPQVLVLRLHIMTHETGAPFGCAADVANTGVASWPIMSTVMAIPVMSRTAVSDGFFISSSVMPLIGCGRRPGCCRAGRSDYRFSLSPLWRDMAASDMIKAPIVPPRMKTMINPTSIWIPLRCARYCACY